MKTALFALALAAPVALFATTASATCLSDPTACASLGMPSMVILDLSGGTAGIGEVAAASIGDNSYTNTSVVKDSGLFLYGNIFGADDGCPEGCGLSGGAYNASAFEEITTSGSTMASSMNELGDGSSAASKIENSSAAALALTGFLAIVPVDLSGGQ